MSLQGGISSAYNSSRIGSIERVLVDDVVAGKLITRSRYESPEVDGEILVDVPEGMDAHSFIGQFLDVRIKEADDYDLFAEVI